MILLPPWLCSKIFPPPWLCSRIFYLHIISKRVSEQTKASASISATRLNASRVNAASKSMLGVEPTELMLDVLIEVPPELLSLPQPLLSSPELLSPAASLRIDPNLCLVIGGETARR